ncbi:MAG: hypothetical protein II782_02945 [Oscillospiraceae bacterium]|nr:hypothetical protein [Oscillospiraceae bacterium]
MSAKTCLLIAVPNMGLYRQKQSIATAAALLAHIFLSKIIPAANAAAEKHMTHTIQKYSSINICLYSSFAAMHRPMRNTDTIPVLF